MATSRPLNMRRLKEAALGIANERKRVSEVEALRYLAKGRTFSYETEWSAALEADAIVELISKISAKTAAELKTIIVDLAKERMHAQRARVELYEQQDDRERAARCRCASYEARHIGELVEALVPA
jgi:hypothetical protein